ncbi:MAG: ABC-F type ribosomal protection protein [Clostridiales Family XIII bacterium]|jgi:lincosamide and streptogramin A transport system ATP-binding/permease protein|nr:ABC-F type ribosomal protection protein [Clostridiales Family XIII bacterium]
MSLIQVKDLTFGYDGSYDNIFEDVSFAIDTDWRLGFTGRNGRGKTTFLRLLMGGLEYSGKIASAVDFAYFPYAVDDKTKPTIEILNGIAPQAEDWEIIREADLLDLDADVLYRPFDTLSGGEQTKAFLSALFLGENRFLLIDEPTNHLDIDARASVGRYLQRKKSFLLVSHDRGLLDLCTDHTLAINKTGIEVIAGNFSQWWEQKQRRDAFEGAQNERLAQKVSAMRDAAARTARWSDKTESGKLGERGVDRGYIGHKAAKMMKRSKSAQQRMERAADEKSQLLKNVESTHPLNIHPLKYHADVLASARDLRLFYGDTQICRPISMQVRRGDRIAVCGKNGSGKSTLLKLLAGTDIKYTGDLSVPARLGISYVPQDTSQLCGGLKEYAGSYDVDESLFKAILQKLDFSSLQFGKPMESYSAGQKKKVLIARSLCEQAHLYIWDEPLNFIDVFSRMQIEELLAGSSATMLFVEHDAAFCEKIATGSITCG